MPSDEAATSADGECVGLVAVHVDGLSARRIAANGLLSTEHGGYVSEHLEHWRRRHVQKIKHETYGYSVAADCAEALMDSKLRVRSRYMRDSNESLYILK